MEHGAPASITLPAASHFAQSPLTPAAVDETVLLPVPVKVSVGCKPTIAFVIAVRIAFSDATFVSRPGLPTDVTSAVVAEVPAPKLLSVMAAAEPAASKAVVLAVAADPKPKLDRAAAGLARSLRLLAFCRDVARTAAAAPDASNAPTFCDAAVPSVGRPLNDP